MAYDRYDTRDAPRDERSRWSGDRNQDRGRGDDRGFWDRASDEVASWFGDDDAERRRRQDQMREDRDRGSMSSDRRSDEHSAFGRGWGDDDRSGNRDYDRGYGRDWNRDHDARSHGDDGFRDRGWERGQGRGYSASRKSLNSAVFASAALHISLYIIRARIFN